MVVDDLVYAPPDDDDLRKEERLMSGWNLRALLYLYNSLCSIYIHMHIIIYICMHCIGSIMIRHNVT